MTELERLELVLRSITVDDTWTPTQLLDAIIKEITLRNNIVCTLRMRNDPPKGDT